MAKGYVIITEDIKDPAGMAEYGKLAMKAMAGATVLSVDTKPTVLEGEWRGNQTVVLEFESVDAAKEWYYSDAYQEAAKVRQGAAECNGVIVSGFLPTPFTLPKQHSLSLTRPRNDRECCFGAGGSVDDRDGLPRALAHRLAHRFLDVRCHVLPEDVEVVGVVEFEHLGDDAHAHAVALA
jgi:uncharacterized protein (DUF1330 family)